MQLNKFDRERANDWVIRMMDDWAVVRWMPLFHSSIIEYILSVMSLHKWGSE